MNNDVVLPSDVVDVSLEYEAYPYGQFHRYSLRAQRKDGSELRVSWSVSTLKLIANVERLRNLEDERDFIGVARLLLSLAEPDSLSGVMNTRSYALASIKVDQT